VVKGPVAGAKVCSFTINGSARGAAVGTCTVTDTTGNYSLTVPVASGPLWIEAGGGSYADEATSVTLSMPTGSVMISLATANGGSTTAMLTPLTTLAFNAARSTVGGGGTLDAAAFDASVKLMLAVFGLATSLDVNATPPGFGASANPYGNALTIFSRMIAAGLKLEDLLLVTQPSTLKTAYEAAASTGAPAGPSAPLVISAATPASLNGTLTVDPAMIESGSSDSTGGSTFSDSNPYCRVAAYNLVNSSGGVYFLQIPFRKDTRAFGLLSFGLNAGGVTQTRVADPTAGISVDIATRRITFTNLVLPGATSITLNGTLDYPTNAVPANRAACG
jgi:hypothetical protein